MSIGTPSETPYARCACGFEAKGFGEDQAVELFDNHRCPRPPVPTRWHESVFSAPMVFALIVAIIVAGLLLEEIFVGK